MSETILTNANVVLEREVIRGTVVLDGKRIHDVSIGRSHLPAAIDMEGDFVAPGLVEMHTDNPEKHFVPRPNVFWPNKIASALAHDAQMAAAGVTTVYDSVCAGTISGEKDYRRKIFGEIVEAISDGVQADLFRIDHKLHIRCELTAATLLEDLEPHSQNPLIGLASLMDHTPGRRQYRNAELLKRYYVDSGEHTEASADKALAQRAEHGPRNLEANWPIIVDLFRGRGVTLATHDDTTEEDIDLARRSGAAISEFPTTVEAATAARKSGIATVAGAPNVVRGGSHSANVSAAELAESGLLDGLSSDYVPASLLQAVLKLDRAHEIALPSAIGMVTWRIADMVGLSDRGRLKEGLRADVVWFRDHAGTPVVRGVWSQGRRAL
ncbi:MAG: alpha-D-ribose 1-methylphosphonate 5-triphosphate diphosphatase [Hyphomicrobiaceae bacterium]